MNMVSLADLAPIVAAIVGPLLVIMLAMMRYQHVDSTKTRTLMHELLDRSREHAEKLSKETREHAEKLSKETREHAEQLNSETREDSEKLIRQNFEMIRENRKLIEKNHAELTGGLGEVRERLSYIEGLLRQPPPPPPLDGDVQAA